jgi:hypothetical protein
LLRVDPERRFFTSTSKAGFGAAERVKHLKFELWRLKIIKDRQHFFVVIAIFSGIMLSSKLAI